MELRVAYLWHVFITYSGFDCIFPAFRTIIVPLRFLRSLLFHFLSFFVCVCKISACLIDDENDIYALKIGKPKHATF